MTTTPDPYRGFRFPAEIIAHAVWLYHCFSFLTRSRFNPARGGPAPTDVRGVFLETLKAVRAWNDGEPEPHVELRGRQVPASAVAGLLWNCSDFLPWSARDDLAAIGIELHQGATYAAAARELKGRFSEPW